MEQQIGRESQKDNDLFFTCSLIDYIARKTKNERSVVVNALGKKRIEKIYDLADVYHSDNIDRVSDDFIEEANISHGQFDNVGECEYAIPTHWDIGKVYKRLIKRVSKEKKISIVDAFLRSIIPSLVLKLMTITAVCIVNYPRPKGHRLVTTQSCQRIAPPTFNPNRYLSLVALHCRVVDSTLYKQDILTCNCIRY